MRSGNGRPVGRLAKTVSKIATLRCLINAPPPLINFSIFFQPSDLIRNRRLLILRQMKFFTNSLLYIPSLLLVFRPNFKAKLRAPVCILVFCCTKNCFSRFIIILKSFSKSDHSPVYFDPPHLVSFLKTFSDSPIY